MTDVLECTKCSQRTFYKKHRCQNCGNDDFQMQDAGVGIIKATTTVHVTPDGLPEPLALAFAVFGGAQVIAQLDGDLSVGDSVRLEDGFKLREIDGDRFDGPRLVAAD